MKCSVLPDMTDLPNKPTINDSRLLCSHLYIEQTVFSNEVKLVRLSLILVFL